MTAKTTRLALGIALAVLSISGIRTIYPSNSQDITVEQLPLNPSNPAQVALGKLQFSGAWELKSRNDKFGGLSALANQNDSRFMAIGDAGIVIGFDWESAHGATRTFIKPLPSLQDASFDYKDRDSEGIAFDPISGQFWVSFEGNHAIRRYSSSFARQTGVVRPREMQEWPDNKGAECLIRLRDGRFIVIAESVDDGLHPALLFSGDPVAPGTNITAFKFRPPYGYRVTDGAQLPDGRIAFINRAIGFPKGFSAKISLMPFADIQRGDIVNADVIASLETPLLVDNFEGIAVTKDGKNTNLWLISDNNFSIFQRTILMKFLIVDNPNNKKPAALSATGLN